MLNNNGQGDLLLRLVVLFSKMYIIGDAQTADDVANVVAGGTARVDSAPSILR